MRIYKNKLNQPLPVELNTDSISVPPKGIFVVNDNDVNSPMLRQHERSGFVCLVRDIRCVKDEKDEKKDVEDDFVKNKDEKISGTASNLLPFSVKMESDKESSMDKDEDDSISDSDDGFNSDSDNDSVDDYDANDDTRYKKRKTRRRKKSIIKTDSGIGGHNE